MYLFITTSTDLESLQPSQPTSQHPPNNEQTREIGQQELQRLDEEWEEYWLLSKQCLFVNPSKNSESIAQPNQAAVNQLHTVEEKEEKTLEQESKRLDEE